MFFSLNIKKKLFAFIRRLTTDGRYTRKPVFFLFFFNSAFLRTSENAVEYEPAIRWRSFGKLITVVNTVWQLV